MSEATSSPRGYRSTINKRRLAIRLVELRETAGLTTAEVLRALSWGSQKLHSLEKAKAVRPSSDDVADLLDLYGLVDGPERDRLLKLTRSTRELGWWRAFDDVFSSEFPGFEAGASAISTFETALIPGLLQTPKYIELVTRGVGIEDPDAIKRHVDARLTRQQILSREEPCDLHAVIDEAALLRISDLEIRNEQIKHILEAGKLPHVTVQVLLLADGIYPGRGIEAFTLLAFPEPSDPPIAVIETTIDIRMLEREAETVEYRARFDRTVEAARDAEATRAYLLNLTESGQ